MAGVGHKKLWHFSRPLHFCMSFNEIFLQTSWWGLLVSNIIIKSPSVIKFWFKNVIKNQHQSLVCTFEGADNFLCVKTKDGQTHSPNSNIQHRVHAKTKVCDWAGGHFTWGWLSSDECRRLRQCKYQNKKLSCLVHLLNEQLHRRKFN